MDEKKRPQSVAAWQQTLFSLKEEKRPRRKRFVWLTAAAVLILAAIAILGALNKQRPDGALAAASR